MAKPKFYLDTVKSAKGLQAVKMLYSFNSQRLKYHTQISVDEKHFQEDCNKSNKKPIKTIAPYGEQHNERLADIALDAVKIVTATKGELLTVNYVREQLDLIYKSKPIETQPELQPEFVHDFVSYYTQAIEDRSTGKRKITRGNKKGNRFTINAIKNYKTSLAAVKRYLAYKGISVLNFVDVNSSFYDDFMNFIYDVDKKEVSTFAGYIKDIKSIMNEVAPTTFNSQEFVKPTYEADTIYLNDSQIDMIANLDLSDHKKNYIHSDLNKKDIVISYETLEKVRNLSLVGFYSGLRFSDYNTLKPKNIVGNFIKLKQTKTGAFVTIPIMEKLKPVLAMYPDGLQAFTNQRFNFYIKIVAKLAGLTKMQKVKSNIGGIEQINEHPLYSLVSSHCCRRSYATNMFNKKVPTMLIQSATGHKSESSFLKYIRTTDEQKANLFAETLKDLGL